MRAFFSVDKAVDKHIFILVKPNSNNNRNYIRSDTFVRQNAMRVTHIVEAFTQKQFMCISFSSTKQSLPPLSIISNE